MCRKVFFLNFAVHLKEANTLNKKYYNYDDY